MLTYLRYTLATVCFAASVGCLVLWWGSMTHLEKVEVATRSTSVTVRLSYGYLTFSKMPNRTGFERSSHSSYKLTPKTQSQVLDELSLTSRRLGQTGAYRYFPLWYPSLILVLAGVGVLRFRRQFSIRSAMICLTVAAALLGIAVVM